jgi:hypothetical protein
MLLENNSVLHRSINVRNPYVDPLSLMQVEQLRRMRQTGDDDRIRDALLVTINGIAAGMHTQYGLSPRSSCDAAGRIYHLALLIDCSGWPLVQTLGQ